MFSINLPSPFGGVITVWNANGERLRTIVRPQPFFDSGDNFAFAAGNRQLVAPPLIPSEGLAFTVFDVEGGEVVREVAGANPGKARYANAGKLFAAAPDQSLLAVSFGPAFAQPVTLFSMRDWTKVTELPDAPKDIEIIPNALSFSHDSRFLAVNRAHALSIFDLSLGKFVLRFDPFQDLLGGASAIAFNPKGELIAAASFSQVNSTERKNAVRVFSTTSGSRFASYAQPFSPVKSLTWSPDGSFIAFIASGRVLHLWSPFGSETDEKIIELSAKAYSPCLAFSPDGEKLAVAVDRAVRIYKVH
jgi:WD40 repeat protein